MQISEGGGEESFDIGAKCKLACGVNEQCLAVQNNRDKT